MTSEDHSPAGQELFGESRLIGYYQRGKHAYRFRDIGPPVCFSARNLVSDESRTRVVGTPL